MFKTLITIEEALIFGTASKDRVMMVISMVIPQEGRDVGLVVIAVAWASV